jgi:hypothetical protein
VAKLFAAQVALAAWLAACASLVGVQDGVLEVEGGTDATTEASPAEAGVDATPDTTIPPEAATDSGAVVDTGSTADSAPSDDAEPTEDSGVVEDATVEASAEAGVDAAGDTSMAAGDAAIDAAESGTAADAGGCETQVPNLITGIFVAPGGTDGINCGTTPAAPCASVQAGLDSAFAQGHTVVYLAAGNYTESIIVYAGITLQGGWNDSAGSWTPICSDAGAAEAVTITAPATSNVTVTANAIGGAATLSTVTLASMPQASVQPGESIYGIIAIGTTGASTALVLEDVVVQLANGGAGLGGAAGSMPAAATGTCTAGTGATGAAGPPGLGADGGTFLQTGYVPGDGTTATVGSPGSNGVPGGAGVCANGVTAECSGGSCKAKTSTNTCGGTGPSGCAGAGGGPGTGASGGGSSIVLYIWDATVTCSDSTLAAGAGGAGGTGGAGGDGGAGSAGQSGTAAGSCDTTIGGNCLTGCTTSGAVVLGGGTAGGAGGTGGVGGQGGGGAGGSACVYFTGGGGTFTPSTSTLTFGAAGAGGAFGGASGVAQPRCL